jgi:radical SAM protein with 4Fe4S-binding SPASM domain
MIEEILDYFVKDLQINSLRFNIIHPSASAAPELFFPEEQAADFVERLINKLLSLDQEGWPTLEMGIKDALDSLLIKEDGGFCLEKGCQYGKYQVSFDVAGNIYPCELIGHSDQILGNVANHPDLSKLLTKAFQEQNFFVKTPEGKCRTCSFWAACRGGCSSAVKYNNNFNVKIDSSLCSYKQALFFRLVDLILNRLDLVEKLFARKVEIVGD